MKKTVLLGGTPTATGMAPYRYEWFAPRDVSNSKLANPTSKPCKLDN